MSKQAKQKLGDVKELVPDGIKPRGARGAQGKPGLVFSLSLPRVPRVPRGSIREVNLLRVHSKGGWHNNQPPFCFAGYAEKDG